jgi:hypothetical protein
MADPAFRSFDDFWPFYVREHAKKATRNLHFAGTTLAMASVAAGLLTRRRSLLLAAPVVGYGMAWIGHFFVEQNRPATFSHPLWSFRGDMIMWWKTLTGTMDAEVERVTQGNGVTEPHAQAAVDQSVN